MTKPATIGQMIDNLEAIREKKRVAQKVVDDLAAQYSALEAELMERLEKDGTDKASSKKATVSITQTTVANVTDWDAVHAYIKKHGYFHLMQRRISDPAFRELYELELNKLRKKKSFQEDTFDPATVIPGFVPFTKKSLNLRSIKAA